MVPPMCSAPLPSGCLGRVQVALELKAAGEGNRHIWDSGQDL